MESFGELAQGAPLPLISLLLLIAMVAARELGALAHRAVSRRGDEPENTDEGYILNGVLGLLALLVAFTFSLALNRFDERRDLVVAEANALGTAWLRTSLVEQPEPLRQALRTYAQARVDYGRASGAAQAVAEQRANDLQKQVWATAVDAVKPHRDSPTAILLLTPVNEAIDLAASRRAVLAARLPSRVLTTLILYAVASAAVLGYAMSGAAAHHRIASAGLFALVVLALSLILDLDRPREGFIKVSQAPMVEAAQAMSGP